MITVTLNGMWLQTSIVCSAGWVFVPEGQLKITDMSHTAHSSPLSLPPSQTLILYPSLSCSSVQEGLGVSMVTGFMWVQSVEYRWAQREGRESCKCEENWIGSKRERERERERERDRVGTGDKHTGRQKRQEVPTYIRGYFKFKTLLS